MVAEQRIDGLEERIETLEQRLDTLVRRTPVRPVATSAPARAVDAGPRLAVPVPDRPVPPATAAAPTPAATPAADLEEILGGRVLAWVGAVAVLVGLFLLLVIAVSRGWIGEAERTAMAGVASLALLLAGAWLHERGGRTEASLAAAATGIAGLFGTLAVAGAVYELVPAVAALAAAFLVGAAATALALRWDAPGIAALGILGALLAPALVGALPSGEAIAFLAVAAASATAVLLWRRWNWLAFAAFAITTPQWLLWLGLERPSVGAAVAVLATFGSLTAVAAIGFEVRSRAPRLRVSAAVLLVLNALVLAGAGWLALSEIASDLAGHLWLAGLAAAHLAVGLAGRGTRGRISRELSLAVLALGVVLADVAFAATADGLPVLAGWAASTVGFAALLRHVSRRGDEAFARAGLGGHLLLALAHALVLDARPDALAGGVAGAHSLLALALVAAGCAVSARLTEASHPHWRAALDGLGLAVLAYLTGMAFEGLALTAALAAEAVALGLVARRADDAVATAGALAYLAAALGHALVVLAPPAALVAGLTEPLAAAAGLGAVAMAAAALARLVLGGRGLTPLLGGAAALTVIYLASVELISTFQPGAGAAGFPIAELGVREQGQALLSALWALAGFGGLVAGLLAGRQALRRGALALLLVTVGKVFLYDLSSLTSIYRVASFTVLGLLLLGAAFAWQRVRPGPLPDMRGAPTGVR